MATLCGFTYTNYRELRELYEKYHDKGLEILAFPCNQFGEQEPGTDEEIDIFTRNYGVNFPVFSKVSTIKCLCCLLYLLTVFCFVFIVSVA